VDDCVLINGASADTVTFWFTWPTSRTTFAVAIWATCNSRSAKDRLGRIYFPEAVSDLPRNKIRDGHCLLPVTLERYLEWPGWVTRGRDEKPIAGSLSDSDVGRKPLAFAADAACFGFEL
jgi:hypothetical protein